MVSRLTPRSAPEATDREVLLLWHALTQSDLGSKWSEAFRTASTRAQFDEIGLPAGVEPDSAWDFYRRITSLAKVTMGQNRLEGSSFAFTPEMISHLNAIDMSCTLSIESSFDGMRDARARFVTRALMEEAINSAMSSGASISWDHSRALLRAGLDPRTNDERSLINRFNVFSNLDRYADRRFDLELIREMYLELTRGLQGAENGDIYRIESVAPESRFVQWNLAPLTPPDKIETALKQICDLLEERAPYAGFGHPLITGLVAYFWLAALKPFRLSDVGLARAIAGLYLYQQGYRTLHLLPLSDLLRTSTESFEGELSSEENPHPDITRFLLLHLGRIRVGLDDLWKRVEARADKEHAMEMRMRHAFDLNRRQKTIVARALDTPHATFRVKYHQRSYSLSRSSAFRDLQGLVQKGYLTQHRVGHAWEYVAAPDIREKVAEA